MGVLADGVMRGEVRAAARLMRDLDDRVPGATEELAALFSRTGRAFVLGITGNPGAGKSTVTDVLIERYRAAGKKVGVVAVDPSSPFSGGAILGDRIRMQRHATDPGVFIRSLATRGHMGGLSRSTSDVVAVLDAMGFDVVIIETVGVGQDEMEVISLAHTALVVTVPGLGDDIQAIKAGILEIADVLVVNKADREGSDRTVRDLTQMLELRSGPSHSKVVEIVKTIALRGTAEGSGMDDLMAAIERHRATQVGEAGRLRARERARSRLVQLVEDALRDAARAAFLRRGSLDAISDAIAARTADPFTVAAEVAHEILRPPA